MASGARPTRPRNRPPLHLRCSPGPTRNIQRMLAELDSCGPVVVVIDDIHLSDHATLLFTRFLGTRRTSPNALVVITARPGDELDETRRTQLDELARDADEFPLGHLGHDDVVQLLRAGGVDHHDFSLIDALVTLTGGLPLAIERTVLALDDPGNTCRISDQASSMLLVRCRPPIEYCWLRRPHTARQPQSANPVDRRLHRAEAFEVSKPASSCGSRCVRNEHHVLSRVDSRAVGGWLPPPTGRIRVHRDALPLFAAGRSSNCHSRPPWSALAEVDPAFTSSAVELSLAAAEFFGASGHLRGGADAYDQAALLTGLAGGSLPNDHQLADADAALGAGRLTRARELYQRVGDSSRSDGRRRGARRCCSRSRRYIVLGEHRSDDVVASVHALQQRALEAVAPVDASRALRLRVRLAGEASYQSRGGHRPRATPRRGPRVLGHRGTRGEALSIMIHAKLGPQYARHRLALADEMTTAAAELGHPVLVLLAQCWKAVSLAMIADERAPRAVPDAGAALPDHSLREHSVHRRSNGGRTADQRRSIRRGRGGGGGVFRVRSVGRRCRCVDLLRRAPCTHPVLAGPPRRARRVRHRRRTVSGDAAERAGPCGYRSDVRGSTSASGVRPIASSCSSPLITRHELVPSVDLAHCHARAGTHGIPVGLRLPGTDIAVTIGALSGASSLDVDGGFRSRLGRLAVWHGAGRQWRSGRRRGGVGHRDRPGPRSRGQAQCSDRDCQIQLSMYRSGKVSEARTLLGDALADAEEFAMTGWVTTGPAGSTRGKSNRPTPRPPSRSSGSTRVTGSAHSGKHVGV